MAELRVERKRPSIWRWIVLLLIIALLAIVHYFIQSKLETYQPVLMAGFLIAIVRRVQEQRQR